MLAGAESGTVKCQVAGGGWFGLGPPGTESRVSLACSGKWGSFRLVFFTLGMKNVPSRPAKDGRERARGSFARKK